ncbi:MAG: 4Fe-4S binding protein [Lachnospiraceae bacterium]|nr:4Fe-4S binding protein [Lachnospiraceae bacterium]
MQEYQKARYNVEAFFEMQQKEEEQERREQQAQDRCKATKNFRVNDNCIGCGLCETVCPKNLIRLQEGKPVWVKDNFQTLLYICCISTVQMESDMGILFSTTVTRS